MPEYKKIKTFHSLLHYTHMKHAKDDLLAGYGVASTKDLDTSQIDELIAYLTRILREKESKNSMSTKRKEEMHKCLKLISQIGIDTQDWNQVNKFMLNKHVCGKHLYELSTAELIRFQKKLYAIRRRVEINREQEIKLMKLN